MLPGLGIKDDIMVAAGQRRLHLPHRHPLHRGGRLHPALRPGPRARSRDRRLPDDGALDPTGEARASRPGSWPTPAASACTWSTRPARSCSSRCRDRVAALVAELGTDAQVGFHGHENLGLGVANSSAAVRAGAKQIDGSHPTIRRRRRQHAGRGVRRRLRQDRRQDRYRLLRDRRRRRGRGAPGDAGRNACSTGRR